MDFYNTCPKTLFRITILKLYLGYKYKTQRPRVAKYDKCRNKDKRRRLFLAEDEADGHAQHAHDGHVVDRDPDVFGVVESWNLDLAGFPGQKGSE